jgi:glycosyltransferase involved in cell wall biosynthesis
MAQKYDCAVILPALNERHLDWTVCNVIRTRGLVSCRIVVVYDGEQAKPCKVRPHKADGVTIDEYTIANGGTGRSRDYGIENCAEPVCILLDAHMDFANGWLERMVDHIRLHPNHVATTVSEVMLSGTSDPVAQGRYYYGARIVPVNRDRKTKAVKGVLSAKWKHGIHSEQNVTNRKGPARYDYARSPLPDSTEIIECVLGGAYAIGREWYMDGLNRPWAKHMTWGTAEPTVAIPNWLCGGESVLLPVVTRHLYYTNKEAAEKRPISSRHVESNQLRLARMIPMDQRWRTAIEGYFTEFATRHMPQIEHLLNAQWAQAYREWLGKHAVRSWADYVRYWQWEDVR